MRRPGPALVLVCLIAAAPARAETPAAQEPAPQSAPAAAATKPAHGGSLLPGGDARQPVTIDADKLEWFDREQKAVYSGHVVATQGEASLKANRLSIFLSKAAPAAARTPAGASPKAGEVGAMAASAIGEGQIERMEADGPVELIQKDQTATGDRGLYERAKNTVTLFGHVTLRQGPNVTRGDSLVYDLDSRQALVQNPKGLFAPRPAAPAAP